jgi:hypothetical protein
MKLSDLDAIEIFSITTWRADGVHTVGIAQWAKWRAEHPGCNFGVVAFASQWITLDTDIKPAAGQTAEDARAEAWSMRGELFKSWGMNPTRCRMCNRRMAVGTTISQCRRISTRPRCASPTRSKSESTFA